MKGASEVVDWLAIGRSLAHSAVRRGASPAEALKAMSEALPSLFRDRMELLVPIQALLLDPSCAELLGCSQPGQRSQLLQRLWVVQRQTYAPPALTAQQAFLEGVLEGWFEGSFTAASGSPAALRDGGAGRSSLVAQPDLTSWLMGLGAGILLGGIGAGLAVVALRAPGLDGPAPEDVPPGPERDAISNPIVRHTPGPRIPERCARLAGPALEQQQLAAATNYAKRLEVDAAGSSIPSQPALIVLHETVLDLPSTIALFQRSNADDAAQGSYHVLIARDGRRVRIVPDHARAFGAGDSGFGDLRFQTSATNPPSINNVALHVSLETPPDGRGDADAHSGYTAEQYRSLAAQVIRWQALYGIPMERITTHAAVDRSHSRYDPRSFRWERFDQAYNELSRSCA